MAGKLEEGGVIQACTVIAKGTQSIYFVSSLIDPQPKLINHLQFAGKLEVGGVIEACIMHEKDYKFNINSL